MRSFWPPPSPLHGPGYSRSRFPAWAVLLLMVGCGAQETVDAAKDDFVLQWNPQGETIQPVAGAFGDSDGSQAFIAGDIRLVVAQDEVRMAGTFGDGVTALDRCGPGWLMADARGHVAYAPTFAAEASPVVQLLGDVRIAGGHRAVLIADGEAYEVRCDDDAPSLDPISLPLISAASVARDHSVVFTPTGGFLKRNGERQWTPLAQELAPLPAAASDRWVVAPSAVETAYARTMAGAVVAIDSDGRLTPSAPPVVTDSPPSDDSSNAISEAFLSHGMGAPLAVGWFRASPRLVVRTRNGALHAFDDRNCSPIEVAGDTYFQCQDGFRRFLRSDGLLVRQTLNVDAAHFGEDGWVLLPTTNSYCDPAPCWVRDPWEDTRENAQENTPNHTLESRPAPAMESYASRGGRVFGQTHEGHHEGHWHALTADSPAPMRLPEPAASVHRIRLAADGTVILQQVAHRAILFRTAPSQTGSAEVAEWEESPRVLRAPLGQVIRVLSYDAALRSDGTAGGTELSRDGGTTWAPVRLKDPAMASVAVHLAPDACTTHQCLGRSIQVGRPSAVTFGGASPAIVMDTGAEVPSDGPLNDRPHRDPSTLPAQLRWALIHPPGAEEIATEDLDTPPDEPPTDPGLGSQLSPATPAHTPAPSFVTLRQGLLRWHGRDAEGPYQINTPYAPLSPNCQLLAATRRHAVVVCGERSDDGEVRRVARWLSADGATHPLMTVEGACRARLATSGAGLLVQTGGTPRALSWNETGDTLFERSFPGLGHRTFTSIWTTNGGALVFADGPRSAHLTALFVDETVAPVRRPLYALPLCTPHPDPTRRAGRVSLPLRHAFAATETDSFSEGWMELDWGDPLCIQGVRTQNNTLMLWSRGQPDETQLAGEMVQRPPLRLHFEPADPSLGDLAFFVGSRFRSGRICDGQPLVSVPLRWSVRNGQARFEGDGQTPACLLDALHAAAEASANWLDRPDRDSAPIRLTVDSLPARVSVVATNAAQISAN